MSWQSNNPVHTKEELYKKLQHTILLKKGESGKKIKLSDYCEKHKDVPINMFGAFTEIHGYKHGLMYKFAVNVNKTLYYPYNRFTSGVCVFWVDGEYVYKEKMEVDAFLNEFEDKQHYNYLAAQFQQFNAETVLHIASAYSDDFILEHANMKLLEIDSDDKRINNLIRRIKIRNFLNQ
jgi:hypothetical protein